MALAIVLMGVSGCGKTTIGEHLSETLGWPFFDGDNFHPQENVAKMSRGIPLNDEDRTPWLTNLHDLIARHLEADQSMLLACSALKRDYRVRLAQGNKGTVFVYLKGDFDLILGRMRTRPGHYMKAGMLQSQFDTLEEPRHAVVVHIDQSLEAIEAEILGALHLG